MLTKRQKQVINYINGYISKNEYAPSLEEIKTHLKLSSVSTAHFHIKKLESLGYLKKSPNHPRAIMPNDIKETISIPLLGTISAGQPIEAIEIPEETISIPKDEISKQGSYYSLKVRGNSMIEEGIFDGDIVVVKKQAHADNGQTVVAIIDDNQATLKKYFQEKNRIRLQPANLSLFPIYRKEIEIRGIVTKIIRDVSRDDTYVDGEIKRIIPNQQKKADKYSSNIFTSGDFDIDKIYNIDCMDLMKNIKDNSIDLIFADPPYNLSKSKFKIRFVKSGGADLNTDKGNWDRYDNKEFEDFTKKWLSECYRILKDNGSIWVAGTYHNIYLTGYLMSNIGFEILNEVLWHKSDATPNLSCTRFVADHENFIWARKTKKCTFNYEIMKKMNNNKQMRSIWTKGKTTGGKKIHPTQKPEWLLERIIIATSNQNNLVFDPFVGSGTTAVVAKRLNRHYLGAELSEEYFLNAKERIDKTHSCTPTI